MYAFITQKQNKISCFIILFGIFTRKTRCFLSAYHVTKWKEVFYTFLRKRFGVKKRTKQSEYKEYVTSTLPSQHTFWPSTAIILSSQQIKLSWNETKYDCKQCIKTLVLLIWYTFLLVKTYITAYWNNVKFLIFEYHNFQKIVIPKDPDERHMRLYRI